MGIQNVYFTQDSLKFPLPSNRFRVNSIDHLLGGCEQVNRYHRLDGRTVPQNHWGFGRLKKVDHTHTHTHTHTHSGAGAKCRRRCWVDFRPPKIADMGCQAIHCGHPKIADTSRKTFLKKFPKWLKFEEEKNLKSQISKNNKYV